MSLHTVDAFSVGALSVAAMQRWRGSRGLGRRKALRLIGDFCDGLVFELLCNGRVSSTIWVEEGTVNSTDCESDDDDSDARHLHWRWQPVFKFVADPCVVRQALPIVAELLEMDSYIGGLDQNRACALQDRVDEFVKAALVTLLRAKVTVRKEKLRRLAESLGRLLDQELEDYRVDRLSRSDSRWHWRSGYIDNGGCRIDEVRLGAEPSSGATVILRPVKQSLWDCQEEECPLARLRSYFCKLTGQTSEQAPTSSSAMTTTSSTGSCP